MAVKSSDQISIVDVTDAYSVILTSEAYTFVGGTSGAAVGSTCTTQAVAYCGTNQCSAVNVSSGDIVCPTGISASVSNSGSSAVTITFTTTAVISSACEATIPVVVDGITVNKKFSFAVALTGATGATGETGATGATGATGVGVSGSEVVYQSSTSGTTVPTGTWSSSIPSVSAGSYLWTRTTISYTDGTSTVSYSVAKMGSTGATGETGATGATGVGVSSSTVTYQYGSSDTTAPTGTWASSIPSTISGEFLWTRTVITYSDDSESTSYSISAVTLTLTVTSSNGTVFKNSEGSTVLTAHVYANGVEQTISTAGVVANSLGTVKWYAGSSTTGTAASTYDVSASTVDNVLAITCQLEG